jgi:serine/threonine-protein kinase
LADASNHQTPSDAADTAAGGSSGPRAELGPGDTTRAGTGFDTALGRLLVERGVIQQSSLDDCLRELRTRAGDSRPTSLQELLAERNLASGEQIDKVRGEVEASAEASKGSTKIPGYQMLRKLGQGAMAKVFLARQKSLDRLVAIKVLPPKLTTSNFVARFQKEGRAAASLSHNNIVAAYEIGEANGYHYFVMEYVDGDTVYDRIVARKRLPEREALDIIRQIASALEHAHERGFVHRDIKPRNIMMTRSGVAKLADLGLARSISDKELAESEAGRAYGTPFYISPEQIQGKVDIGPPADIYGLGATFYHMVTGKVPYEGTTPSQVMHKHLKAPLVPPDHLNPQLSANAAIVIETMLKKDARERYQNAKQLLRDLDLVLAEQEPEFAKPHVDLSTIATAVNGATPQPAAVVRRDPRGALASSMMLVLIAVATLSVVGNIVLGILLVSR